MHNIKTDKDYRINNHLLYSSATSKSHDKLIDIYPERKGVVEIDKISRHCIDTHTILCSYDIFGICADSFCPHYHLVIMFSTKNCVEIIPKYNLTVALPELKLPQIVDDSVVIIENLSIIVHKF